MKSAIIESLIASSGIMVVGIFNIPLVASITGISVNIQQSIAMSAMFFAQRCVWLFFVRLYFEKKLVK